MISDLAKALVATWRNFCSLIENKNLENAAKMLLSEPSGKRLVSLVTDVFTDGKETDIHRLDRAFLMTLLESVDDALKASGYTVKEIFGEIAEIAKSNKVVDNPDDAVVAKNILKVVDDMVAKRSFERDTVNAVEIVVSLFLIMRSIEIISGGSYIAYLERIY